MSEICDLAQPMESDQSLHAANWEAPLSNNLPRPAARMPLEIPTAGRADRVERHQMLLLHLPQVRLVARGIWDRVRFAVELDDLIGYGMIGLLKAVERFNPERGILLKTYAEYRIRGAILDGLRGMDWLPRSARHAIRNEPEMPDWPGTRSEVTPDQSGRPTQESRHHRRRNPREEPRVPRSEGIFTGGALYDLEKLAEWTRCRFPPRHVAEDPEHLYERKERFARLASAVSRLPRRQQRVIELYYFREMSMKQIGATLGVHESRVSQLHAAATIRLRKHLTGPARLRAQPGPKRSEFYRGPVRERPASKRLAACQSSSVSTPIVSALVSAT
jgi:RNA polymerase sigma factor FliA